MKFEFPIEITTVLNGKKTQAMVFEAIPDTDNCYFKVRFEDGFEDKFFLAGEDGDLGPIGSRQNWTPYSTAIRPDLLIISQLKEGQQVATFRHTIDGVETNVWVTNEFPQRGRDYFYVYYNQYCRFQFDKNPETEKWRILDNYSGHTDVNLDLVQIAGAVIQSTINKNAMTA
jgi:hypothetical protein